MNWVDVAIVAIIVGSVLLGLSRGLVVEIGSLVGAAIGLYVARQNYRTAAGFLALFSHHDARLDAVAFLLVFLVVWIAILTVAQALRSLVHFTPLVFLDRLGGFVIGLVLGVALVQVLLVLAVRVHDPSLRHSIHASSLASPFRHAVPHLKSLIPPVRGFRS